MTMLVCLALNSIHFSRQAYSAFGFRSWEHKDKKKDLFGFKAMQFVRRDRILS